MLKSDFPNDILLQCAPGMPVMGNAANWTVGVFTVTALGMYTWCERRRRQEAQGMAQAVAGTAAGMTEEEKKLQEKKKKEEQEAREKAEAVARLAEEERRKKSWTNLNNYKFW